MAKRVLIFGGAGFIGSHLITSLLEQGYGEVISADIAEPTRPVEGTHYLNCDVREPIPLDLADGMCDDVYNLAAVHRTPGHADHEYFDTNVPGATNVCTFCRETGAKKLVFTSSIAVYGPSEEAKDESSEPAPVSMPRTSMMSLIPMGMPCRGPRHLCWLTSRSICRAASRAPFASIVIQARISCWRASMRRRV